MKHLFTLAFILVSLISFSQTADTLQQKSSNQIEQVSFYTVIDESNITKDGVYVEGYILNLDYDQVKELSGKKIKITGEVSIVTGQENLAKEYDENGKEIFSQGRQGDSKHILAPKIELVGIK
jgi:opacity protein-like surface antigen